MRERWPAARDDVRGWLGALAVLVLAVALVALDLSTSSVREYWSRHPFTASVTSGLVVLLLTVLVADRIMHIRQLRRQARAIGVQAAVLISQAQRTADAIADLGPSSDEREAAADELRTYTVMLLTSAPLLIDATGARAFLERGQRVGVQLSRVLRATGAPPDQQRPAPVRLDEEIELLRQAAAPLLSVLSPEERAAIGATGP